MIDESLSRKAFLKSLVVSAAVSSLPGVGFAQSKPAAAPTVTLEDLRAFQKVAGLSFSDAELKELLPDIADWISGYHSVRGLPINELTEPPTVFMPKNSRPIVGKPGYTARVSSARGTARPAREEDLAFMSVRELGELIRTRQISSQTLTELSIKRLEQYGDKLLCLVTLLADDARAQARRADEEIRQGHYRGPLHGIPCGVKDLFAVQGAPTTWGAAPYEHQVLPYDAAVVDKLRAAGAIVVAKLSMGALAQGDVWFKGKTRNPWRLDQGSSGSSAGSASATAAGIVPFAIGTETLGSIMSPSNMCRVTGLRPTYGRVSRFGAMGLSYTMDKVGPICRSVEDCALVFAAIAGADPRDRSSVDRPFHYSQLKDLTGVRIGYVVGPKDDLKDLSRLQKDDHLKMLVKLGAAVSPVHIEQTPEGLLAVLEVEAASAFDALTRSEQIHELKNSSWPESFRASRFVPGVEYLQAQRGRALLMDRFESELGTLDALVLQGIGGNVLRIANLTGHPQVLIPFGVDDKNNSRSISFLGRLYEEDRLLAIAKVFQDAAGYQHLRPDMSKIV
jgi:Asp-tRNA(Asn)/Glu-tRNA(Gln) amidotransferase A subunit family amidase